MGVGGRTRRKTAAFLSLSLQLFVVLFEAYGFFYPIAFTPWEVDSLGIVGNDTNNRRHLRRGVTLNRVVNKEHFMGNDSVEAVFFNHLKAHVGHSQTIAEIVVV